MLPKKKDNKKGVLISLILTIVVLIVSIVIIKTLPQDFFKKNMTQQQEKTFNIGDQVVETGAILEGTGNLSLYTHILMYGDNKTLGLKSKDLDLSLWTGQVQISGTVVDIKDFPIIDVADIQDINPISELTGDVLTGDTLSGVQTKSKYYFGEYGMYFDFAGSTGYNVTSQGGDLIVQEVTGEGTGQKVNDLLTISPYICEAGSSTKDCAKIQSSFETLKTANFTSSNGIKFWNHAETSRWIFFNDSMRGYSVGTKSEGDILKLSKFIYLWDKDTIKTKIQNIATTSCKNSTNKLTSVKSVDIAIQDSRPVASITGSDDNGNTITCKLAVNIGTTLNAKLLEIKNSGSAVTKQEDTSITSDMTGDAMTGDEPANKLKFQSNYGFVVFFPKYVTFDKQNITSLQDLGLNGIKCVSKIDVINYKRKSELSTNPSLEIFVCETNLDEDTIAQVLALKDITYKKGEKSGKNFFIQSHDSEGKKIINESVFW